ncbi:MAG: metallophosphoesterase [bacterium]|nr:metallophosphoesterase [bacterium]
MSSHNSTQKWLLSVPALAGASEAVHWFIDGLDASQPAGLAVLVWLGWLLFQAYEKVRFIPRVRAQRGLTLWAHVNWVLSFLVLYPSYYLLAPLAGARWFGWIEPEFSLAWGPWLLLAGALVGPFAWLVGYLLEAPARLLEFTLACPPDRQPLKLLFISDLHLGNLLPESRLDWVLSVCQERKPDALLIGGDLVDHDSVQLAAHQAWFRDLVALLPVYAVLGNHDIVAGRQQIQGYLEAWGVTVLRDQVAQLPGGWTLVGALDIDFEQDCAQSLLGLPKEAGAILLSHNPDLLKQLPVDSLAKVALCLSGHTHGGQIRLPWIGPILHPADRRFVPGLTQLEGLPPALVSQGLGYTLIPMRWDCPAEAIWLEWT